MKSVLQMAVLLVVILLATFYLLFPKKEGFLNLSGVTSSTLYMDAAKNASPTDIDNNFQAMSNTLADKGSLLHMRRCYQFPNETLESFRNKFTYTMNNDGMYYTEFDMVTCQFNDVESRIVCELQRFKDKICGKGQDKRQCASAVSSSWSADGTCPQNSTPVATSNDECTRKVQGPVYAFVFQAPYYRVKDPNTNEERTLALQFQTLDTRLIPYNSNKNENDVNTPLFVYVQLLFPRYNKNGTYMPHVDYMEQYYLPEWDRKYFSKEMQCFMKATKKYDMVAGCASTNAPYEAKCLGPKTALNYDVKDEKNTLSTYGILYQVNKNYALFNNLFDDHVVTLSPPLQNPEVFHVKGTFTSIDEAQIACDKVDGVLASREDVYDAYAAGHNVCEQGYIADGYIATASQGTLASCQGAPKFAINYNQDPKNVGAFCYGTRPQNDANVSKWDARGFASKLDWLKMPQNKIKQNCGTFSEEKYFAQYPDTKESKLSGLQHWLTQGIAKGYKAFIKDSDMSGNFDANMYQTLYTGNLDNLSALEHLSQKGVAAENRVCVK